MSKKSKVTSIEIPAAYTLLEKLDKTRANRKVIISADGTIHVFPDATSPVPSDLAIDCEFKNFDEFSSRPRQTILLCHDRCFHMEPPKKQDSLTTAAYTWAYFVKEGRPHIPSAPTTAEGKPARKSTISTREYYAGAEFSKSPLTAMPHQASTCLSIFTDVLGKSPSVTEADLKVAITNRASELKTKQDPWRIFQYYRPTLIKLGLIKHN